MNVGLYFTLNFFFFTRKVCEKKARSEKGINEFRGCREVIFSVRRSTQDLAKNGRNMCNAASAFRGEKCLETKPKI